MGRHVSAQRHMHVHGACIHAEMVAGVGHSAQLLKPALALQKADLIHGQGQDHDQNDVHQRTHRAQNPEGQL